MSPRSRVYLGVATAAIGAVGIVVGVTLATRTSPPAATTAHVAGPPPLVLDLGVRTDAEAQALRQADALYTAGKRADAAKIFGRYRSLEAQVGSAVAGWPAGKARLVSLAEANPRSALAQLYLGLVRAGEGGTAAADAAWRAAKRLGADSAYGVAAGDLLHPNLPVPGLPQFVPSFPPPPLIANLSPPQQLAYLRGHARDVRGKILYGVALQRLERPVSAEREFAAAGAASPNDSEALAAAAVGLFDKDNPSAAFARLGPLAKRFPRAQTVRFHLGLLLVWLGQVKTARQEFGQARALEPLSTLGQQAAEFLKRLP